MSNSPYDVLVPENPTEPQPQEPEMNGKPLVKSKTFWINLVTIVAGIVTLIGGSDLIQENPQYAGLAATVIGVVNILLRLVTKEPVTVIK